MPGAREFGSGGATSLAVGNAAKVSASPWTFAGWAYPTSSITEAIIAVANGSSNISYFDLRINSTGTIGCAVMSSSASEESAVSSTTVSLNAWNHAAGTYDGATLQAFLNGGGKGTASSTDAPASLSRSTIGRRGSLTAAELFTGYLAHCAIWNVVLTDKEIAELALGANPVRIRPDALVSYVPICEDGSNTASVDFRGGPLWTKSGAGTMVAAPHGPKVSGPPALGRMVPMLRPNH